MRTVAVLLLLSLAGEVCRADCTSKLALCDRWAQAERAEITALKKQVSVTEAQRDANARRAANAEERLSRHEPWFETLLKGAALGALTVLAVEALRR